MENTPLNLPPNPRVLVIIPTTRDVNVHTLTWAFSQASKEVGVLPFLHKRASSFVEDARQAVIDAFLPTNIPWLLTCDSDTIPQFQVSKAVFRAESIGAKLVAFPTPFIGPYPGVASNLFVATADPETPDNIVLGGVPWHELPWDRKNDDGTRCLFDVDSAGLGCTLIHRDVLVTLMDTAKKGESDYPMRAIWKEGKVYYGEDQAFFLRAKAAGFTLYADLECYCNHYKAILMNPNLARDYYENTGPAPHPDQPYDNLRYEGLKTGKPLYNAKGDVLKVIEGGRK